MLVNNLWLTWSSLYGKVSSPSHPQGSSFYQTRMLHSRNHMLTTNGLSQHQVCCPKLSDLGLYAVLDVQGMLIVICSLLHIAMHLQSGEAKTLVSL